MGQSICQGREKVPKNHKRSKNKTKNGSKLDEPLNELDITEGSYVHRKKDLQDLEKDDEDFQENCSDFKEEKLI